MVTEKQKAAANDDFSEAYISARNIKQTEPTKSTFNSSLQPTDPTLPPMMTTMKWTTKTMSAAQAVLSILLFQSPLVPINDTIMNPNMRSSVSVYTIMAFNVRL
jgi:hypothetical protein